MGKFYLENIVEKEEQTVKSLQEFNSRDEAEAAFHREISYPTQFDDTLFVRCTVINSAMPFTASFRTLSARLNDSFTEMSESP